MKGLCFLNKLRESLENCEPEEFLFIGGDFNCTENDVIDRNHNEPHKESQRVLQEIINIRICMIFGGCGIKHKDSTRGPQIRQYHVTMARLDRWYCFKHHFNTIKVVQFYLWLFLIIVW